MNKIIDDINKLMKLSREELDEVLLDNKYNKANLRELIRRLTREAKLYRDLFLSGYENRLPENYQESIKKMMEKINELESIKVKKISSYKDYSYGFANGLKYAIGILLGEIK